MPSQSNLTKKQRSQMKLTGHQALICGVSATRNTQASKVPQSIAGINCICPIFSEFFMIFRVQQRFFGYNGIKYSNVQML
jgi:hypothetical protein